MFSIRKNWEYRLYQLSLRRRIFFFSDDAICSITIISMISTGLSKSFILITVCLFWRRAQIEIDFKTKNTCNVIQKVFVRRFVVFLPKITRYRLSHRRSCLQCPRNEDIYVTLQWKIPLANILIQIDLTFVQVFEILFIYLVFGSSHHYKMNVII